MDLLQLASRLEALASELDARYQQELETVAETGKAMVIQRVSETGKDANGAAFKGYTPEYERYKRGAVGTAQKESKRKRAERRSKPATPDKPVGRYRGFVDFTLTGRMLSNIGLVEKGKKVVVGGRSEETKLKMEGNDKNRPGWFRLSKEEIDLLRAQSRERMTSFAREFLEA